MTFYRRRLPHIQDPERPLFITWRLRDSLPPQRAFPSVSVNSGEAFLAMDRMLDEARGGAFYLRLPAIADMITEAIEYNANMLGHYALHAFVVMPNHVHLLATPAVPLPRLMKSLKGITAKRANEMLARTGRPFWVEESYDHLVRHEREFEKIKLYIEEKPVRAGLVGGESVPLVQRGRGGKDSGAERRKIVAGATRGSPADLGVRPTAQTEMRSGCCQERFDRFQSRRHTYTYARKPA